MGNKRRIIRGMKQTGSRPVPMMNTGLVFNGCKVFLSLPARPDPDVIKKFGAWIGRMVYRSRQTNMGDIYAIHIAVGKKITALKENENLFNGLN